MNIPNQDVPHFDEGVAYDPALQRALASLNFRIQRRLNGMMLGNYLDNKPGHGTELGEHRLYQVGDDVRRIDWNATARSMSTQIRQTIADRELEVWLVVQLSPQINFGTLACTKRDLAILGAAVIVNLALKERSKIGLVVSNGQTITKLPARGGNDHANRILRTIVQCPQVSPAHEVSLRDLLHTMRKMTRKPGAVAVVSDFSGEIDWSRELCVLAQLHSLIAVWVLDRRDVQLPVMGPVALLDPQSGKTRHIRMDTHTVQAYNAAAQAQIEEVKRHLRKCRAHTLSLRTDRDWSRDLLRFIRSYKQGA